MTNLNAYLTFSGNCREAMHFYQQCLGGELSLQTIGESPMADKMPPQMRDRILHGMLKKDGLIIMASDMVPDEGLQIGNAVALMVDFSNEEETRSGYSALSAGGRATHPLAVTFWGALFGDLTDKFGNHWLLHFDKNTQR